MLDVTFSCIPPAFTPHVHNIHRYYHSIVTDVFQLVRSMYLSVSLTIYLYNMLFLHFLQADFLKKIPRFMEERHKKATAKVILM